MAFIDRLTYRFTRFSLYFFWICILLAVAFCGYVGVSAFSGGGK
jgi:hypothetical protein